MTDVCYNHLNVHIKNLNNKQTTINKKSGNLLQEAVECYPLEQNFISW